MTRGVSQEGWLRGGYEVATRWLRGYKDQRKENERDTFLQRTREQRPSEGDGVHVQSWELVIEGSRDRGIEGSRDRMGAAERRNGVEGGYKRSGGMGGVGGVGGVGGGRSGKSGGMKRYKKFKLN
jgi:hypothetical protein